MNVFLDVLREGGCPQHLLDMLLQVNDATIPKVEVVGKASDDLIRDVAIRSIDHVRSGRDFPTGLEAVFEEVQVRLHQDIANALSKRYRGPSDYVRLFPVGGVFILPPPLGSATQ